MKKFLVIFILIFGILGAGEILAGAEHNVWGWAWSENIGWISFNRTNCDADDNGFSDMPSPPCPLAGTPISNYGVHIASSTGNFSGYAWAGGGVNADGSLAPTIGWIRFDSPGPYPAGPNYSACLDLPGPGQACDGVGNWQVSGWARALAHGGGWDGWIKLRCFGAECATSNYGVWIDFNVSPAEFHNWAWGSDVVGWISSSCSNQGVCATSSYEVLTSLGINQPPTIANPHYSIAYCDTAPGTGEVNFFWDYSDPDTDNQAQYRLEVKRTSPLPLAPLVDCTVDQIVSTHGTGSSTIRIVGASTPALCDMPAFVGDIHYAGTFEWRVSVKDSAGKWSNPTGWQSFSTAAHAYPRPDFTPSLLNPNVNQVVTFTDNNSKCYSAPGNVEYNCQAGASTTYEWDFNYIPLNFTVDSTVKGNPTTTYANPGPYAVRLRITDPTLTPFGVCATDRNLTVAPLPVVPPPPIPPGQIEPPTSTTSFPEYVKYLFNLTVLIAGLIALGVLVWAGILYLTSAGNAEQIDRAKKKIIGALFGLAILLGSYLILATINPQLIILSLQPITSPTTTPPTFTPPTPPALNFQEIPIGTLVENILAKNISCFDEDGNLIDCRTGEFIQASTTWTSTSTNFYYCYEYDSEGNKEQLIQGYDQLYCIKNLIEAMKIKSEKLATSTLELKNLSYQLAHESLQLKSYANNCHCAYGCSWSCAGCGCGNSSCACGGCFNSSDNCPNRANMNTLRRVTIRNLIEQIEKKRIEIYAFIYGAKPTDSYTIRWYGNGDGFIASTTIYYLPAWDPATTTRFLTFQEGLDRLNSFESITNISKLNQDLNDLKEAEELMKLPFGDRLTLAEFQDLKMKSKIKIEKTKFKDYDILRYCYNFNCSTTTAQGLCTECQLATTTESGTTTANRMCQPEGGKEYVFDGDGATFYYHEKYNEEPVLGQEKCAIELIKEEKSFPLGLIPIGETVDEAEEFASSIIGELEKIGNALTSIKNNALDARESARLQIVKVYELIELTSEGANNAQDCVVNCQNVPCSCGCGCFGCGTCGCCSEYCACIPYYCVSCIGCSGTVCPWATITATWDSIAGHYNNIFTNLTNIGTALTVISTSLQKYTDLITATNLGPNDPNKCAILHKLTISRQKLDECITGYGLPWKQGMTETRVFGSRLGLYLEYSGKLVILPSFPYPASTTALNCYPFNSPKLTPAQKQTCRNNKDSNDCQNITRDLMDNYYCCKQRP